VAAQVVLEDVEDDAEQALEETEDVLDRVVTVQVDVVGDVELESAGVEEVVDVWDEKVFFFFVFDDHVDLDEILEADVEFLVGDVSDDEVDGLMAVLGLFEYAGYKKY